MANPSLDPNTPDTANPRPGVTRRTMLKTVGIAALAADALHAAPAAAADPTPDAAALDQIFSGTIPITLTVNGKQRTVDVEPRTTLLSALRDRLDPPHMGPKLVCDAGTCGACTVILDGQNVYGCSVLAIDAVGKPITTVEGIGTPDKLSPVQQAFCEKDAQMCGFCTAGFVTSVTAYLRKNPNPTLDQLKSGIKGNFCRCGTYPHIFEAALAAAKSGKPI